MMTAAAIRWFLRHRITPLRTVGCQSAIPSPPGAVAAVQRPAAGERVIRVAKERE